MVKINISLQNILVKSNFSIETLFLAMKYQINAKTKINIDKAKPVREFNAKTYRYIINTYDVAHINNK